MIVGIITVFITFVMVFLYCTTQPEAEVRLSKRIRRPGTDKELEKMS